MLFDKASEHDHLNILCVCLTWAKTWREKYPYHHPLMYTCIQPLFCYDVSHLSWLSHLPLRAGTLDATAAAPEYHVTVSGAQGSAWQEAELQLGERGLFRPVFTASTSTGATDYGSIAIDDISFLTCPGASNCFYPVAKRQMLLVLWSLRAIYLFSF